MRQETGRELARGGAVSATFAALVVLVWHTGLMLLIRWITLRLAPRLLNRRDEELRTAVTVEEDAWRSVTLSEVPG